MEAAIIGPVITQEVSPKHDNIVPETSIIQEHICIDISPCV